MATIVPLPLANQLTNGTTADATQVMADLNAIANAVNSNAASLSSLAATTAPTGASLVGYGGTDLGSFLTVFTTTPTGLLSLNGGPIGDIRNRVVNGDFRIDQRNEGASQTFTAAAALAYCADRFYGYCTGANVTGQRITTSGVYRYRFTGAASVTAVGFGQRMLADSTSDLAGTTATLSALLSSSSLTTITWTAYYANSKNTFGTLASPTRTQIATGTFTITSSEAQYSAQISIPSAAITGIEIVFTGGALLGTQTLTIGDVFFIRSGTSETNFPRRPEEFEMLLCQEHMRKTFARGTAPATNIGVKTGEWMWGAYVAGSAINIPPPISFQPPMFAAPTITFYNPAAANALARDETNNVDCTSTSLVAANDSGFSFTATVPVSTTVSSRLGVHWVAISEL